METINKAQGKIEKARHYGPGFLFWKLMNKIGLAPCSKYEHYIAKYYLGLTPEEREQELKKWFLDKTGYPLDLDNPKTFNEKIRWLKLYDSISLKTQLADKYLVRDWIREQIGDQYLIPLLGVWDSFDDIDLNSPPNQFVLKANHGSAMNLIVKDATQLDLKKTREEINLWFHTDYGINENQGWHYLHTVRKVLAEKYIGTGDSVPADYKVYCFNGIPKYIQVIEGRFGEPKQLFLNTDWETMPFWHTNYEKMDAVPKRPKQLEEMLLLSEKLAKGFALVRIDWYLIGDEKIYFGEMTFTPANGIRHWVPEGTDDMLGGQTNLKNKCLWCNHWMLTSVFAEWIGIIIGIVIRSFIRI